MNNLHEKTTILLVDDDETVLGVGSLMIEKLGYDVLQAKNGTEAVRIYKENMNDICLVILDEKLPDEPGSDTCKRLKEHDPNVKVLHTSGLGKSMSEGSLKCGCDAFLIKPFKIDELSNKLHEILANTQA
jgi:DNA-binding response OmpR family regulator